MNRRNFLALASTGTIGLLAGCSFGGKNTTPSQSTKTTQTQTSTPLPDDEKPPSGYKLPNGMAGLYSFARDIHKKNVQNLPFKLDVVAVTKAPDRDSKQDITFRYNGKSKSFFTLEFTQKGQTGTLQQYSEDKILYIRRNPPNGDIQYEKETIKNGSVFMLTGTKQITQLERLGVTVKKPQKVKPYTYRYQFKNHPDYDSVSGFLELDLQQGVFTQMELHGESKDETYDISMKFSYGGVTVPQPAWIKAMNNTTTSTSTN